MNRYKPEYLGGVIPAEDSSKMTDFVHVKYDAFSKIYDACKEYSNDINSINLVESDGNDMNSLTIKINTNNDILNLIKSNNTDESVIIKDDLITATITQ